MNLNPHKPTPARIPAWRLPSMGTIAKVFWVSWAYFFLLAPMVVVIGSSFDGTTAYSGVVFPPQELTWKWYQKIPSTHYKSLGLSLGLALAVFGVVLGAAVSLGAWGSARRLAATGSAPQ